MSELDPLVFQPVVKERIWGGQRLSQFFPDLPAGRIGEAWVLSDHPQGRTPVVNGALAGRMLGELHAKYGAALLRRRDLSDKAGAFPLLLKLLDAQDDLSVQVHPADDYPGLAGGELGKTGMWWSCRVYDYDLLGLDGRPRELQVEHALAVSHYQAPPAVAKAVPPQPGVWQEFCRSPFFAVAQGEFRGEWRQETSPLSFEAVMILTGVGLIA